jgi:DNA-binding response OmpR family regulator
MRKSQTILIVDDDLLISMVLVEMLVIEGFTVQVAHHGSAALASMDSFLPDLILLDIHMPDIDGFEVCRRLKANEKTKDIPIIYISASADNQDRETGLKLGAVDFISKPFKMEELLKRIKSPL